MGGIKRVLENIAELAVDKIDHWIATESDEFYQMDEDEKLDLITDRLTEFFEQYGDSIADEEGISGNDFREFVSDHYNPIARMIASQLG